MEAKCVSNNWMSGLTTIHKACQEAGSTTRVLCERRVVYCQHRKRIKDACVWLLWSWTCHLWVKGLLVQKTRIKECHHIALFLFSCFQRSIDKQHSSFFWKLFPVLSHIIKQCTTFKNIQGILKQLSLTHIAVIYNEYVYNVTREITMGNATEFENIVLCLTTFHRTKFPWEIFTE